MRLFFISTLLWTLLTAVNTACPPNYTYNRGLGRCEACPDLVRNSKTLIEVLHCKQFPGCCHQVTVPPPPPTPPPLLPTPGTSQGTVGKRGLAADLNTTVVAPTDPSADTPRVQVRHNSPESTWRTIGIIAGSVAFVILLLAFMACCIRKRSGSWKAVWHFLVCRTRQEPAPHRDPEAEQTPEETGLISRDHQDTTTGADASDRLLNRDCLRNRPLPNLPTNQPNSRADQSHSRADQPNSPADQPNSPADQPNSPADQPNSRADQLHSRADQPNSPTDQPNSPADQPNSRADQPNSRADQPNSRADQPNSPANQPNSPADQPNLPADQPHSPADQPNSLAEQQNSPAEQPNSRAEQPTNAIDQTAAQEEDNGSDHQTNGSTSQAANSSSNSDHQRPDEVFYNVETGQIAYAGTSD